MLLHGAHEHALALGQPHGAAQPTRDARGHDRHAQTPLRGGLAGGDVRDPLADWSGGEREDQAVPEAHRVQAEQPALAVEQRPTARAARQRSRVLDQALQQAPARAAQRLRGAGDRTGGHAQAAPARIRQGEHARADHRCLGGVRPGRAGRLARVHLEHRDATIRVGSGEAAALAASVGEHDRGLLAPQVASERENAAALHHHPAAASRALGQTDDRRPRAGDDLFNCPLGCHRNS